MASRGASSGPAALALSIDCDGCTLERLQTVFAYWATDELTPFGRGLNLPVAASLFAYARNPGAPPQAAYLDGDRDGLREAFRRGWIDTIHALGDFSADRPCTRDMAQRAFEALAQDDIRLTVWTNHGGPENIQCLLKNKAQGDLAGSSCYLADLAEAYGIRFVWTGDVTPVIGQNREAGPGEYYFGHVERSRFARLAARAAHPLSASLVRSLGFEPFPGNRLVERRTLRDGRSTIAFRRYGRWRHDTIARLPDILSREKLDRLVSVGGAMIVYLHIGPSSDETPENFRAGMKALDEVARRHAEKSLRVARTAELLKDAAEREGLAAGLGSYSPR